MPFSRRDLFHSGLRLTVEAAARAARQALAPSAEGCEARHPRFLRPPGALAEPAFLAACTRCDACIAACPRESLRRAGHELGPENEGTPVILPHVQPCWLCEELPCIAACEPGALRSLGRASEARMATVRIDLAACFAALGNPCEVCSERCPTRPKAITWSFGSAPALDGERCTGCAVCVWLCPAQAIDLIERG